MAAYYNEHDPFAAAWLRELIKRDLITPGDVDERSIVDVRADDLVGYGQCHFFAGIGVWSYALRCAGWPDDRPVWTGSCPCQPFSSAGKQKGFHDARHLWPEFFLLIRECRPDVCFGEQTASPLGRAWLDTVSADLEGIGYAVGQVVTCAAGIGAPHIRHRLYFVADTAGAGSLPGALTAVRGVEEGSGSWNAEPERRSGPLCGLADADGEGRDRLEESDELAPGEIGPSRRGDSDRRGRSPWADAQPVEGADGTWRLLERGVEPLADGTAARVERLRGYGNGLCAPQAAAFIEAYLDVRETA